MAVADEPVVELAELDRGRHREDLGDVVRDPSVMEWVANGVTWTDAKMDKFFDYCDAERREAVADRQNFYHAVMVDGRCAGVVGIHPIAYGPPKETRSVLTVFIGSDYQNKGVGSRAIQMALDHYWRHRIGADILVDVRSDNAAMQHTAAGLGFTPMGNTKIGGRAYRRYLASPL